MTNMKRGIQTCSHLYLITFSLFGVVLFLYGFFPLKNTSENFKTNVKSRFISNNSSLNDIKYDPVIGRLVFMVIDALRADFISGADGSRNVPYLTSLVEEGVACMFTARADSPTVTLPRIKALVTGGIPGFIDVILNLGSPELKEDNIISKIVSSGKKAVFYGDDTWLRLFPDSFFRSEGTTSFFVTDFSEVDKNVTRHLKRELESNDWTLMVLHYLGLDHIGHLAGPRSVLIQPKLREMDEVVHEIHTLRVDKSLPQLLIVCGDHGMKDSGGHGGASYAETHVSVVAVGLHCHSNLNATIAQVDVAPTLSVLLGLSIPTDSVGALVPELLSQMPPQHQLAALFTNAMHLASILEPSILLEQDEMLKEVVKLHEGWLQHNSKEVFEKVRSLYMSLTKEMSSTLSRAHTRFDLYALAVGVTLVLQGLLINVFSLMRRSHKTPYFGTSGLLWLIFNGVNTSVCSILQSSSVMCSTKPSILLFQSFTSLLLAINFNLLINQLNTPATKWFPIFGVEMFLLFGSLLQSLSLGGSSTVEEEHQVWYFLWVTLLMLLWHHHHTSWLFLTSLLAHRVARGWNQTGDKWASVPDVEDWLTDRSHLRSTISLAGLILVGIYIDNKNKKSCTLRFLLAVALITVYLHKTAIGGVELPIINSILSPQGLWEARLFGICWLLLLAQGLINAKRSRSSVIAVHTLRDCWLLGSLILCRPHDTVLIPVQLLTSHALTISLRSRPVALATAHMWLGSVIFFYQGNSNSLASIDVASGYVGLQEYQPVLVGTLLLSHTYAAPVLSHLLLLGSLLQPPSQSSEEIQKALYTCSALRLVSLCFYLFVISWQREHLFIWSVFAPKLLYEATATLVSFISLSFCYMCLYI